MSAACFLPGCGGPADSVELHGYNGDKMVYKYNYKATPHQLENGEQGYLIQSIVHFSEGSRKRRIVTTDNYLRPDFSLHHQEKILDEGVSTTQFEMRIEEDKLVQTITGPGGMQQIQRAPVESGPYLDIPPLMFAEELTKPGAQKIYRVFSERQWAYRDHTVRFEGVKEIKSGKKIYKALHYKVEQPENPGSFNDYYLDQKTKLYLRMDVSPIRLILPK